LESIAIDEAGVEYTLLLFDNNAEDVPLVSAIGSFIICKKFSWLALVYASNSGCYCPIRVRTGCSIAGFDCTNCRRALNCGWLHKADMLSPLPPDDENAAEPCFPGATVVLLVVEVEVVVVVFVVATTSDIDNVVVDPLLLFFS
jgi:hypothetical protein